MFPKILVHLKIQYLWMAGSCATNILHPASLGVAKNNPGAIPGVNKGALGSSWKKPVLNFLLLFGFFTMKVMFWFKYWGKYWFLSMDDGR